MTSSRTSDPLPSGEHHDNDHALRAADDRLVWIDLEMTGLDPAQHTVVEVAAIITDAELHPLGEGLDVVVHASEEELARMNDFVTSMHSSSGLVEMIRSSTITMREAEDAILALIAKHCAPGSRPLLAGNSIATDRTFIRAYMPRLDEALHYRMIDVSTIKELTRRWFPRVYQQQPGKSMCHRALADIIESIQELDYYRRAVFVPEGPSSEQAEGCALAARDRFGDLLTSASSAHPEITSRGGSV